jgi:hypothetical protein
MSSRRITKSDIEQASKMSKKTIVESDEEEEIVAPSSKNKSKDKKINKDRSLKNVDKIVDDIVDKYIKNEPDNKLICMSVRHIDEPHNRCLFHQEKNQKFCAIHLLEKKPLIFNGDIKEIEKSEIVSEDIINPILITTTITNTKKKPLSINTEKKPPAKGSAKAVASKKTIKEHNINDVQYNQSESEADLDIKLLILINDEEYADKIPSLIGPVYDDITLSDDDRDPVTFDIFWELDSNNKKIPSDVNKYLLFSYKDDHDKIRCFTVFTLDSMIKSEKYEHPTTTEPMSSKNIKRAKKLIDIYTKKLTMFKQRNESNLTPEFKLKVRINKLFSKYHVHNIYLEDKWLLDIDNTSDLLNIITTTSDIAHNNLTGSKKLFKKTYDTHNTDENVFLLKEYIVREWEKMIELVNDTNNQVPIWIIASGLSDFNQEIFEKYPTIEMM